MKEFTGGNMARYCICGHVAEDHSNGIGVCLADDQCDCDGFIPATEQDYE